MAQNNSNSATNMTMAAIIIGLSITENMSADDQNIVANLLFAAAQAISTRASLIHEDVVENVPTNSSSQK
ncbi:MAG: hypothetical protein VB035_01535 [Candidatus Fimivivens sp.]|nr:hypothetical protein [Candidatus Fimivivens sp.]